MDTIKNSHQDLIHLETKDLSPFLSPLSPGAAHTSEQIENAARTCVYTREYGAGKPVHGVLRAIQAVTIRHDGVDVTMEPQAAYESRVFDYAQQCYVEGKTHVVGEESWVWPNEFIPRGRDTQNFCFAIGKVQSVAGAD